MAGQRHPDKRLVAAFVHFKTKKKFERLAKKRGITVSDLLRELIDKAVS